MEKEKYAEYVEQNIKNSEAKKILLQQIENYFKIEKEFVPTVSNYQVGDSVYLPKGTLLHGTYKNIEGLQEIVKSGLMSNMFIDGRDKSKYPASVSVWNLKQNYYLKDYINFYSGGTIMFYGVYEGGIDTQKNKSKVIPYDNMSNINEIVKSTSRKWMMEETKEARFMPSLAQDRIQIGVIFNGMSDSIKELLKNDILSFEISDEVVQEFLNSFYYEQFLKDRRNKDDFFTDRESSILFGIPSCFIEGVLVGRIYENNEDILNQIKTLLPNCYVCNLDGKVIRI